MLQLVHGRADETLRTSSTLESLQRLAEGGYVSRRQAKKLSWDYRFERVMDTACKTFPCGNIGTNTNTAVPIPSKKPFTACAK